MAETKKTTTKKPTGLKIKRDGVKFECSWKIADKDYNDGQTFERLLDRAKKDDKWKKYSVTKKATAKTVKIDKDDYYPHKGKPKLVSVKFRVKGNREKYKKKEKDKKGKTKEVTIKPSASDWSTETFKLKKPNVPSVSASLNGTYTNITTFSWNVKTGSDDKHMFTDVEWQSIRLKNNAETNPKKIASKFKTSTGGWQSGTGGSSGSKAITEDTSLIEDGNTYTRWFRVRSRGVRGHSAWKYASHVYARSNRPAIKSAVASDNKYNGIDVDVQWTTNINAKNPVDSTTVQYLITVPAEGITVPVDASWTDASVSKDIKDSQKKPATSRAKFTIPRQLDRDQVLFVRVNTKHDRDTTEGWAKRAKVGYLKDPSDLSIVNVDEDTHRATIRAKNNSEIVGSVLVVRYVPKKGGAIDVGIITANDDEQIIVQCPDWSTQESYRFEVYAMVGKYSKQQRADGVDSYKVEPTIRSKATLKRGGNVPVAPENVTAVMSDTVGTVMVSWDWSWEEANGVELSWADHRDAWESTDEPDTYKVSRVHASKWYISGLETGVTWYIRVRFMVESGDDTTYGPYSDISDSSTVNLSSAPNIPSLELSDAVITESGQTIATWVYSSTDKTPQVYAEIAQVVDGDYSNIIAHAETAQQITLAASGEGGMGWQYGQTYNLALRVHSASGNVSEWSDVVSVTVADPLTAEITEFSVVDDTVEVNPRSFEGDVVSFTSDVEEDFAKLQVNLEPKQSGSGTPSPSNIRPISGWDEVEVVVSPTQSADDGTTYQTTLPQTVYGGTVDLVSGEVVIDRVMIEPTTAQYVSYNQRTGLYLCTVLLTDKAPSDNVAGLMSDQFHTESAVAIGNCYVTGIGQTIVFVLEDQTITTKEQASAWLADNNPQFCYELATPRTIQLTPQQIASLIGDNNVWGSDTLSVRIAESYRSVKSLKDMPFTITVTGAGEGGTTTLAIERDGNYHLDRPNEDVFNGYDEETVLLETQTGESQMQFDVGDLIGALDDGASYRAVATVQDPLGQSSTVAYPFEVHWTEQAVEPEGTAEIDEDLLIAKITPIKPYGALDTDVCDIYRLSADKPELIYAGAKFGITYVDPYPTIGEHGGHRLVTKTKNGDYITEDNRLAWLDLGENEDDILFFDGAVIDFNGRQIRLRYGLSTKHDWSKDFTETKYLGGSVQGDWNPAVSRNTTMDTAMITLTDFEDIESMRRLAVYAGICHVRTQDGSSFAADIQVAESNESKKYGEIVSYALKITRVDPEGFDAMTLAEWERLQQES